MKKGHNGRKSLRRLKPTVDCNASKRKEEECFLGIKGNYFRLSSMEESLANTDLASNAK